MTSLYPKCNFRHDPLELLRNRQMNELLFIVNMNRCTANTYLFSVILQYEIQDVFKQILFKLKLKSYFLHKPIQRFC